MFEANQVLKQYECRDSWENLSFSSRGSLNQKLGLSPDTKAVVIHLDDIGLSDSVNEASFKLLKEGRASSGSVMVVAPAFKGALKELSRDPQLDIGIHLVLTSEWEGKRWAPILGAENVPSLVDEDGCFYATVHDVLKNATKEDVKKEIEAQLIFAKLSGIEVSHIDSHMGVLLHSNFALEYVNLAKKYKLPAFLAPEKTDSGDGHWFYNTDEAYCEFSSNDYPVFDSFKAESIAVSEGLIAAFTEKRLRSIEEGATYFLGHVSCPAGAEMFYPDHKLREAEFKFFTSRKFLDILTEEDIGLINMKQIQNTILPSNQEEKYGD